MLTPDRMQPRITPGSADGAPQLSDLTVFNRWLCWSRLRAAGGVAVFVLLLEYLHVGDIATIPVLLVCGGLAAFSAFVLRSHRLQRAPHLLFHTQHLIDLLGVTIGIGASMSGTPALLFHLVYVLVIVPPSLVSVRAGLLVVAGASLGHETLLVLEHGSVLHTVASLESLGPVFLFLLVAQQCFFYAQHLDEKNAALAELAAHLQWSRERLAGLVDVARTLNSTLDPPELWSRVNHAALKELGADWAATFLVDGSRRSLRVAAVSDAQVPPGALASAEIPMKSWPAIARLEAERVITLSGEPAEEVPELLTGGRALRTVLLAGLYRDSDLVGCLALGYGATRDATAGGTVDQLNAIVEHATIALRNAQLLEEARQASLTKSEFVSTISHELRTPLNVIIGYTDMLRDGAVGMLTPSQHQIFERIDTEARGLFELIEATLQVGRMETCRDVVTLTRVPLRELIGALHTVVMSLPRSTAIAFHWDAMPDQSGTIVTDVPKIVLIVRNLVINAFKFTTQGWVIVRLRTDENRLVLTVADTGIGIAAGHLPIIFEMFRQLDNGAGRRGGVGLGLYIVKQTVQRLNGTIAVDSTVGRGSEFRVTLPGCGADEQDRVRGAA